MPLPAHEFSIIIMIYITAPNNGKICSTWIELSVQAVFDELYGETAYQREKSTNHTLLLNI